MAGNRSEVGAVGFEYQTVERRHLGYFQKLFRVLEGQYAADA